MCALGAGCATVSWVERFRTSAWRPYRAAMFIGLGVSGVVPILHGIRSHGYQYFEDRMGLSWVILQGALYIFGAVLYVASALCLPPRRRLLTLPRHAGRRGASRASLTFGAARTKSFTSVCCSLPLRTFTAWPRPLTTTTRAMAHSVRKYMR